MYSLASLSKILLLVGVASSVVLVPQDVAKGYVSALLEWISGLGR
jgi:hypothetical protein